MTEQPPSLLRASVFTHLGLQVLALGGLMFALGLLIGTKIVGDPAYAAWATENMVVGLSTPPEYLQRTRLVNKLSMGVAAVLFGGLLYLDWQIE